MTLLNQFPVIHCTAQGHSHYIARCKPIVGWLLFSASKKVFCKAIRQKRKFPPFKRSNSSLSGRQLSSDACPAKQQ